MDVCIKRIIVPLLITSLFVTVPSIHAGGVEQPSRQWVIYIGGFGGIYNPWFQYGATYYAQRPTATPYENNIFQLGYSGGGQVGIQYHAPNPYFLGLVFSGMANSRNARLTHFVESFESAQSTSGAFDINHVFKINYNLDIAGVFGFDITPRSHMYTKAGASYMRLVHYINSTTAQNALFPTVYYQSTQHDYGWGWLIGLGFAQDFNRWLSGFAEYDYYNRGARNSQVNQIAAKISGTQRDVLPQHVNITISSIRVGLNLKFMDQFLPDLIKAANHWTIYLGGFGAIDNIDFAYSGDYSSTTAPTNNRGNTIFNNLSLQDTYSGGGQLGVQYHFNRPYFLGIEASILGVGDRTATISSFIDNSISGTGTGSSGAFMIMHVFRVRRMTDIAGLFGMRVTPKTQVYLKGGGSYGRLSQETFTTPTLNMPLPTVYPQSNQKLSAWGWLIGLGITRDFNRWISAFAEYDHYDYAGHAFNTLYNIAPLITSAKHDIFTHRATTAASTVRLGLNFKFIDALSTLPEERPRPFAHHLIYAGLLGGIYSADFKYDANYYLTDVSFTTSDNSPYDDSIVQRGVTGGGQIGYQYHFDKPYYLGFVFGAEKNAGKGYLNEMSYDNSSTNFTMNSRMRVNYHLDFSAVIGANVTSRTHIYAKGGGSYARIMDYLFTTQMVLSHSVTPSLTPVSQNIQHKYKCGWLAGLGVTQDINRWINVFAEYDHFDYRKSTLSNWYNIAPDVLTVSGRHDRLERRMNVTADAVRVGLNITFAF